MALTRPSVPKLMSFTTLGKTAYCTGQTGPAWRVNHLSIVSTSHGAILSLTGGSADNLVVTNDHPTEPSGMRLEPYTVIKCKDLVSGSHYARVDVAMWADKDV